MMNRPREGQSGRKRRRGARRVPPPSVIAVTVAVLLGATLLCAVVVVTLRSATAVLAQWIASPTPTTTPTSTPTATPTLTPVPTASPTPTPAPPALALAWAPPRPAQGQSIVIRATTDQPARIAGTYDGRPLTFLQVKPDAAWALVGIHPDSPAGERPLIVTATGPEGHRGSTAEAVPIVPAEWEQQVLMFDGDTVGLLDPVIVAAERARLEPYYHRISPEPLWEGTFLTPTVGVMTTAFGTVRSYQGQPPEGHHEGIDIANVAETPVVAAARGRVIVAEFLDVRGGLVMIDHGLGLVSLYAHQSQLAVDAGQMVQQGDLVGLMGSTGLSTGSHLHWEMRLDGIPVDPTQWTQPVWDLPAP